MAIMINNPDMPATKKQLWLLHILTKEDTRDWRFTMQQASDKIQELKQNGKRPLVNPHTSALEQDRQLKAQQRYDKGNGHKEYGGKCPNGQGYWSIKTFKVIEVSADTGSKHGYCTNCFADMASYDSLNRGRPIHYKSHQTAKRLGLWGRIAG